jgi:hypothetical protein
MINSLFVSYSHHDETWMRRLTTHLLAIPKTAAVDVWVDTLIGAGELWHQQIVSALKRSRAAVLLLSADFLTSSFIRNEEIPRLLEAEAVRGLSIFPLLTRPCAFEQHLWLAQRQVRPRGAIALSAKSDSDVDQALADLAREIAALGDGKQSSFLPEAQIEQLTAVSQASELRTLGTGRLGELYFFYLARERIHSLFAQLPLDVLRQTALSAIVQRESEIAGGELSSTAVTAFRLSRVLDEFERNKRIGDLALVIAHELPFEFDWCLIDALFQVRKWDPESPHVMLEGQVNQYAVTLSCTKSNVIGLVKEGKDWIPTSASYFLFEGGKALALKGLIRIVIADRSKRQVMATPLYLTLRTMTE